MLCHAANCSPCTHCSLFILSTTRCVQNCNGGLSDAVSLSNIFCSSSSHSPVRVYSVGGAAGGLSIIYSINTLSIYIMCARLTMHAEESYFVPRVEKLNVFRIGCDIRYLKIFRNLTFGKFSTKDMDICQYATKHPSNTFLRIIKSARCR